jgi:hypothetical protein
MQWLLSLVSPFKWYLLAGTALILGTWWITSQIKNGWLAEDQLKNEIIAHSKDIENCTKTATASKDLSHDYEKSVSDIDSEYISMLETSCSEPVPASQSGGRSSGSTQANQLTDRQRWTSDKQAARLIACQATIRTIYELNGRDDLLPVN